MTLPSKSKILNPKSSNGFTLLELIIVIAIVVILIGLFLVRVPYYQEQAEKASMEQVASAVQSALVMRYGAMMTRGAANEQTLKALATDNPLNWLQQKPKNYAGEYFDPSPQAVAPGNWMFDLKSRDLIYVPNQGEHLAAGKDGKKWIRFHVKLEYEAAAGDGRKDFASTVFESVEPYRWFE